MIPDPGLWSICPDFIPVVTERYDLVVPETTFGDERFQKLLAISRSEEFQTVVQDMGGYDTQDTGDIMSEQ